MPIDYKVSSSLHRTRESDCVLQLPAESSKMYTEMSAVARDNQGELAGSCGREPISCPTTAEAMTVLILLKTV